MKSFTFLIILSFFGYPSFCQNNKYISIREKILLEKLRNETEINYKLSLISTIAKYYSENGYKLKADSIINFYLAEAENKNVYEASKIYLCAGEFYFRKDMSKFKSYFQQAYEISLKENNRDLTTSISIRTAEYEIYQQNYNAAQKKLELDLTDTEVSDTSRFNYYIVKSILYSRREDVLNQLKTIFIAKNIAEKNYDEDMLGTANYYLTKAYCQIHQYKKALNFALMVKAYAEKKNLFGSTISIDIEISDIFSRLGAKEKSENILRHCVSISDSVGDIELKNDAIAKLCELYWSISKQKFVQLLDSENLFKYLETKGELVASNFIKGRYYEAKDYNELAELYYNWAIEKFENDNTVKYDNSLRIFYLREIGIFQRKMGKHENSLKYLNEALELNTEVGSLTDYSDIYRELDATYIELNDTASAYNATSSYLCYEDSLEIINNKDEIINEERLSEEISAKIKTEQNALLKKGQNEIRNTFIVLIALFFGIGILIILFTNLPKWIIKIFGFASFVFLFELIILLFEGIIHHVALDKPFYIFLIKILIAFLLVPLHHWTASKVISFLVTSKLRVQAIKK